MVTDANSGAVWTPGFKERAQAAADAIIAKDSAPDALTRVVDAFPGVLLGLISGSPGMLPSVAAQLVDWARLALSITVKSVTVQTVGTVTVVDHRTKVRCPDCDNSGMTDHDPAMTRCATCGGK